MSSAGFTSPFGVNSNPFGSRLETGQMHRLAEEDENDMVTSPTTPSYGGPQTSNLFNRAPFGGDAAGDTPMGGVRSQYAATEGYPAQYNFGRRTSVSAESLKPNADSNDNWTPPVHNKTDEQLERLRQALSGNFLFSHLDDEQSSLVLRALVEKPIPAPGIKVITQGDQGDFFYVVEKGSFEVYVNKAGSFQPGPDGAGDRVAVIEAGGSFGELALMYNAPRAATVVSAEPNCILWALDRMTFRRILMESTFARRRMYESFLQEVDILKPLTPYERSKIADALKSEKFPPDHQIIKEGEHGDTFFLLEAGEAVAYRKSNNAQIPVKHYKKGDFFGELALLNDKPRAATVVTTTEVKVVSLDKMAFQRLLGPVESILRRTKYVTPGVEEMDPLQVS
ncbi:cyclic adenosine monophosphate-dependent protein kinase [Podospora australis]|uniref:cAMP-dependent protein kinase regulatory subunit n=1 Tax=Podospora australis TaxID=1536484 RepID=A0AAN6X0G5_9PEZI|nr:cyclic adenosine monophosphate-dependent protein kinase [Podospora australis]